MKQKIIIALIIVLIMIGAAYAYWSQLRGIWPVITQPDKDIVQLIETNTPAETATSSQQEETQQQGPLILPRGFLLSVFAKDLVDPRVLAFDPTGVLLASIPDQGRVVALIDQNNDGKSDETKIVASGLNKPHGMAVACSDQTACKLYVAETDKVVEFTYDPKTRSTSAYRMIAPLPSGGGHVTRTLLLYKNSLLVSVGSSCNVCHENDPNRAKILQIAIDTGKTETFATGLRNAVFMAPNPATGDIWATEMGRDLLGDNVPPDEVNIIKKDANYGWPICYGKNIHDTEFDKNTYIRNPCMEPFETPSYIDIPAHSAPLGLAFIPTNWPAQYRNDLLVAYHGSWNRSIPTGYKIVHYRLNEQGVYEGQEDFITGWLNASSGLTTRYEALGRPVDIVFAKDGVAYISDDKAGVVYRLVPPQNK